MCTIYQQQILI